MFLQPLQMLVPFANKNVLNVFLWLLIGFIQCHYKMVEISYVNNYYFSPLSKVFIFVNILFTFCFNPYTHMVHKGDMVKHLSLLLPSEQDKYSSFTFTLA